MPYFKDSKNVVHFLSDSDIAAGGESYLPHGNVQISDAEASLLLAPTPAQLATQQAQQDQITSDLAAKQATQSDTVIQYLIAHTPAECAAYVNANVTDLPTAKALMAKFAMALSVLAKVNLR